MYETTLIIPCAGKSTRFPNLRPKFLLTNPNGKLLFVDAISKLPINNKTRIIITVLREHNDKYNIIDIIKNVNLLENLNLELCILPEQTSSQAETIVKTIESMDIKGPIYIKDSDNIFAINNIYETYNYVTTENLNTVGYINAQNKSYVKVDANNLILNIEEKRVISDTFSIGGYYFTDPNKFIETYNTLKETVVAKEIYISMIINQMIMANNEKFKIKEGSQYVDLGTKQDRENYKDQFRTYFIDVDGIIVINSGEFFSPKWGETEGIKNNIERINQLYDSGNQIILTTARGERHRKTTEEQLKKYGLRYHYMIMGLLHAKRVLINDFSNSNQFPTAIAINIPRDYPNISEFI